MFDLDKFITEEDYKTIIKRWLKKEDLDIVQHSVRPLSDNIEGFLGDHYILKMCVSDYGKTTEHSFFVKTFPGLETQSEVVERLHGFEREAKFFEVYVTKLENAIPGYRATYAPKFLFAKNDKVVVFEDLSVKQYFLHKKGHLNGMDLDHVKLVLKAIALLHSSTLIYEELTTKHLRAQQRFVSIKDQDLFKDEMYNIKDEDCLMHLWLRSGVKGLGALLDVFPDTKLSKDKLEEFFQACCETMTNTSKFRKVLGHNDLWNKNILFKYKNGIPLKAKLVDYQVPVYCPPVHDTVFFILMNSSKEVKEKYFAYLLRYYYSCLSNELRKYDLNPDEVLPFSEIKESSKLYLPAMKLKAAVYESMLCANDEYMSVLTKDVGKFRKFMFKDRGPVSLELFKSDSLYRNKLTSTIADLEDTILGIQPSWEEI